MEETSPGIKSKNVSDTSLPSKDPIHVSCNIINSKTNISINPSLVCEIVALNKEITDVLEELSLNKDEQNKCNVTICSDDSDDSIDLYSNDGEDYSSKNMMDAELPRESRQNNNILLFCDYDRIYYPKENIVEPFAPYTNTTVYNVANDVNQYTSNLLRLGGEQKEPKTPTFNKSKFVVFKQADKSCKLFKHSTEQDNRQENSPLTQNELAEKLDHRSENKPKESHAKYHLVDPTCTVDSCTESLKLSGRNKVKRCTIRRKNKTKENPLIETNYKVIIPNKRNERARKRKEYPSTKDLKKRDKMALDLSDMTIFTADTGNTSSFSSLVIDYSDEQGRNSGPIRDYFKSRCRSKRCGRRCREIQNSPCCSREGMRTEMVTSKTKHPRRHTRQRVFFDNQPILFDDDSKYEFHPSGRRRRYHSPPPCSSHCLDRTAKAPCSVGVSTIRSRTEVSPPDNVTSRGFLSPNCLARRICRPLGLRSLFRFHPIEIPIPVPKVQRVPICLAGRDPEGSVCPACVSVMAKKIGKKSAQNCTCNEFKIRCPPDNDSCLARKFTPLASRPSSCIDVPCRPEPRCPRVYSPAPCRRVVSCPERSCSVQRINLKDECDLNRAQQRLEATCDPQAFCYDPACLETVPHFHSTLGNKPIILKLSGNRGDQYRNIMVEFQRSTCGSTFSYPCEPRPRAPPQPCRPPSPCALRPPSPCALRSPSPCALRPPSSCALRPPSPCARRPPSPCALRPPCNRYPYLPAPCHPSRPPSSCRRSPQYNPPSCGRPSFCATPRSPSCLPSPRPSICGSLGPCRRNPCVAPTPPCNPPSCGRSTCPCSPHPSVCGPPAPCRHNVCVLPKPPCTPQVCSRPSCLRKRCFYPPIPSCSPRPSCSSSPCKWPYNLQQGVYNAPSCVPRPPCKHMLVNGCRARRRRTCQSPTSCSRSTRVVVCKTVSCPPEYSAFRRAAESSTSTSSSSFALAPSYYDVYPCFAFGRRRRAPCAPKSCLKAPEPCPLSSCSSTCSSEPSAMSCRYCDPCAPSYYPCAAADLCQPRSCLSISWCDSFSHCPAREPFFGPMVPQSCAAPFSCSQTPSYPCSFETIAPRLSCSSCGFPRSCESMSSYWAPPPCPPWGFARPNYYPNFFYDDPTCATNPCLPRQCFQQTCAPLPLCPTPCQPKPCQKRTKCPELPRQCRRLGSHCSRSRCADRLPCHDECEYRPRCFKRIKTGLTMCPPPQLCQPPRICRPPQFNESPCRSRCRTTWQPRCNERSCHLAMTHTKSFLTRSIDESSSTTSSSVSVRTLYRRPWRRPSTIINYTTVRRRSPVETEPCRDVPSKRSRVCSSRSVAFKNREIPVDKTIVHPNKHVKTVLRKIGIERLIRASKPAKCCRLSVLNEPSKSNLPYAPSLRSLPLDVDDLKIIAQSVRMASKKKLKYYTHLTDDDFNSKGPARTPHYEVRYFFYTINENEKVDECALKKVAREKPINFFQLLKWSLSNHCDERKLSQNSFADLVKSLDFKRRIASSVRSIITSGQVNSSILDEIIFSDISFRILPKINAKQASILNVEIPEEIISTTNSVAIIGEQVTIDLGDMNVSIRSFNSCASFSSGTNRLSIVMFNNAEYPEHNVVQMLHQRVNYVDDEETLVDEEELELCDLSSQRRAPAWSIEDFTCLRNNENPRMADQYVPRKLLKEFARTKQTEISRIPKATRTSSEHKQQVAKEESCSEVATDSLENLLNHYFKKKEAKGLSSESSSLIAKISEKDLLDADKDATVAAESEPSTTQQSAKIATQETETSLASFAVASETESGVGSPGADYSRDAFLCNLPNAPPFILKMNKARQGAASPDVEWSMPRIAFSSAISTSANNTSMAMSGLSTTMSSINDSTSFGYQKFPNLNIFIHNLCPTLDNPAFRDFVAKSITLIKNAKKDRRGHWSEDYCRRSPVRHRFASSPTICMAGFTSASSPFQKDEKSDQKTWGKNRTTVPKQDGAISRKESELSQSQGMSSKIPRMLHSTNALNQGQKMQKMPGGTSEPCGGGAGGAKRKAPCPAASPNDNKVTPFVKISVSTTCPSITHTSTSPAKKKTSVSNNGNKKPPPKPANLDDLVAAESTAPDMKKPSCFCDTALEDEILCPVIQEMLKPEPQVEEVPEQLPPCVCPPGEQPDLLKNSHSSCDCTNRNQCDKTDFVEQQPEKPEVFWALTKVSLLKDGTKNFEIIDVSPVPPGYYIMPDVNNIVLVGPQPNEGGGAPETKKSGRKCGCK